MNEPPLARQIVGAFDSLSPQLQAAARYVLDRPLDVALLSMREQARRANVQPATMTRLAKRLGHDGYEEIRALYANAMRGGVGFSGRAGAQLVRQRQQGEKKLAADMLEGASAQLSQLAQPDFLALLSRAAEAIQRAGRVYCLGLRSSHSVAWHLFYILNLIGDKPVLVDGIGGTLGDPLGRAGPDDLLVAISIHPYTRQTVELARDAAERQVPLIAITDSPVAPLASLAEISLIISTESASFFHSMMPAFLVAEILGALVAGRGGEQAMDSLRQFDSQLARRCTHMDTRILGIQE